MFQEKSKCSNFIRVIVRKSQNELYICGTNAFEPKCRTYIQQEDNKFEMKDDGRGLGVCPFDPDHNSTAIYTG